ncbi:HAMP domain-containing sensor histidine kinase [Roseimicrobium sp. ORNL1]|uniref:sensor histidine kinase n=1 Tax=Roseimicrobium sp. ORNL1 TaxID=2711231 RepID=UPI0013E134EC|nr:HAMP domain-containing sensor histidine kinase [Roseimicrobium sp. ORNL1]QIF03212.1 HAMP domain-containing histidine kinase [Roseimicrobium sp. ORNL1]
MNRPVHTWLVFLGCLALLFGAMGWVTLHTLNLERERQNTAQEAANKERVRLALWRLDFQASTLVIRENARPPEAFRAFHAPEGFFNRDNTEVKKGEVLAPSPLLGVPPDLVMLHFQLDGQGRASSPQAPSGNARTLALQNYLDPADIQNAETRLQQLRNLLAKPGNGERLGTPQVSGREIMRDEVSAAPALLSNGQILCAWNSFDPKNLPAGAPVVNSGTVVVPSPGEPVAAPVPVPAKAVEQQTLGKDTYAQGSSFMYENALRKNIVESQKVETLPQQLQTKEGRAASQVRNWSSSEGVEKKEGDLQLSSSSSSPSSSAPGRPKAAVTKKGNASTSDAKPTEQAGGFRGELQSSVAMSGQKQMEVPQQRDSAVGADRSQHLQLDQALPKQQGQIDMEAAKKSDLRGTLGGAQQPSFPDPQPQVVANAGTLEANTRLSANAPIFTMPSSPVTVAPAAPQPAPPATTPLIATAKPLQGFWIEDTLLLTREATLDGSRVLQGVWLDWPKLRDQWLAQVRDLFPNATLVPATNALPDQPVLDDPLRLASLPVRLVTGTFATVRVPFWTPMRSSLAVAWCCVGLAGIAVGAVLFGTVALSERRAAFVSAVTHELRTPLTTFRLYSEMLASGMVRDEEQKKNYLGTLEAEAGRLSHLVENVLAYARIERGSARAQVESVSIGDILDRVVPRLRQRAEQAGMEIAVDASEEERKTMLRVDVAALEQILFNLVDNACKYAAPRAADKTIHVQAATRGPLAMLRVRDHGAGISPQERRRVFRPFHKSADKAAHSAPGVGLGLALCERLSKALGGKLSLEKSPSGAGASFVLELPRA